MCTCPVLEALHVCILSMLLYCSPDYWLCAPVTSHSSTLETSAHDITNHTCCPLWWWNPSCVSHLPSSLKLHFHRLQMHVQTWAMYIGEYVFAVLHATLLLTSWNVVSLRAYKHFTVQMSDRCMCVFHGQHLFLMLFDGYIASCLCAPCQCRHPLPSYPWFPLTSPISAGM